jgi:hypothetical protein
MREKNEFGPGAHQGEEWGLVGVKRGDGWDMTQRGMDGIEMGV